MCGVQAVIYFNISFHLDVRRKELCVFRSSGSFFNCIRQTLVLIMFLETNLTAIRTSQPFLRFNHLV